jgi:tRNA (guanine37-N1)-methyltransferase
LKQIVIITPVPDTIDNLIANSMLRQAVERNVVEFKVINLRDFTKGNYRQVDDEPFGGGDGMVMMAEPLFKAIDYSLEQLDSGDVRVAYPSPQGVQWTHKLAIENSQLDKLIFICGDYKGIDERVIEKYVTHEYSIGDFVVTAGELPAMMMIDSIVRLIPGVLNKYDSAMSDTFASDLLDAPYYTRPRTIEGMKVPDVLIEGHHKKIDEWRNARREKRTETKRPDIWKKYLEKSDLTEKKK